MRLKLIALLTGMLLGVEVWGAQQPDKRFNWKNIQGVAIAAYGTGCSDVSRVEFTITDRKEVYTIADAFLYKPIDMSTCGCLPAQYIFIKDDRGNILSGVIVAHYIVLDKKWHEAYPLPHTADQLVEKHMQSTCIRDN
jgi:hypothetical protein